jgi:hypothetical protein
MRQFTRPARLMLVTLVIVFGGLSQVEPALARQCVDPALPMATPSLSGATPNHTGPASRQGAATLHRSWKVTARHGH